MRNRPRSGLLLRFLLLLEQFEVPEQLEALYHGELLHQLRVLVRERDRCGSAVRLLHPRRLWAFLRVRKKYWLLPILLMMVLLGALIVMTQGSAIAPFIYTLF